MTMLPDTHDMVFVRPEDRPDRRVDAPTHRCAQCGSRASLRPGTGWVIYYGYDGKFMGIGECEKGKAT